MSEKSLEDLQKEKLELEIKNLSKSPFRNPAFTAPIATLLLAIGAYWWLAKTGLFDDKQAHIAYITDTLTQKAKFLDTLVRNEQNDSIRLHKENNYLKASNMQLEDSIQRSSNDYAEQLKNDSLTIKRYKDDKPKALKDILALQHDTARLNRTIRQLDIDVQSSTDNNKKLRQISMYADNTLRYYPNSDFIQDEKANRIIQRLKYALSQVKDIAEKPKTN